jgi:monoterpene epsilon-lactone hydrolase
MTDIHQRPIQHIPARDIPVPRTVSKEAQAALSMGPQPSKPWPPLDDRDAVQAQIDEVVAQVPEGAEGAMVSGVYGFASTGVSCSTERIDARGVGVWVATPEGVTAEDRRVYLALHGAWIYGGGEMARSGAVVTAGAMGARTWVVDYRMPPHHPYPAPLDDCVSAYRALLEEHRPEDIIVGGVSAGGNLTVATLLRARDEGLPLPAAAVAVTPGTDLTRASDTHYTNMGVDPALNQGRDQEDIIALYTNGHDLRDPYVSPVFGDFAKGFPPTILTSGTRDFLLSDTVRLHRALLAAGVPAELHVWEAAPHYMFLGTAPEDHERGAQIRAFCERQWGK